MIKKLTCKLIHRWIDFCEKTFIGFINWKDNLLDTWKHKPQPKRVGNIYETI